MLDQISKVRFHRSGVKGHGSRLGVTGDAPDAQDNRSKVRSSMDQDTNTFLLKI